MANTHAINFCYKIKNLDLDVLKGYLLKIEYEDWRKDAIEKINQENKIIIDINEPIIDDNIRL